MNKTNQTKTGTQKGITTRMDCTKEPDCVKSRPESNFAV